MPKRKFDTFAEDAASEEELEPNLNDDGTKDDVLGDEDELPKEKFDDLEEEESSDL